MRLDRERAVVSPNRLVTEAKCRTTICGLLAEGRADFCVYRMNGYRHSVHQEIRLLKQSSGKFPQGNKTHLRMTEASAVTWATESRLPARGGLDRLPEARRTTVESSGGFLARGSIRNSCFKTRMLCVVLPAVGWRSNADNRDEIGAGLTIRVQTTFGSGHQCSE